MTFGLVVVWFILLWILSRRLNEVDPGTRQYLGLDSLFGNVVIGTGRLLVFLYSTRFRHLNDSRIDAICTIMMLWIPTALLWLFGPFVLFIIIG